MKTRRIIHGVLLVLGLSLLGLLFYYLMWLITDEEFREMLKYGWPWTSGMILVDYIQTRTCLSSLTRRTVCSSLKRE